MNKDEKAKKQQVKRTAVKDKKPQPQRRKQPPLSLDDLLYHRF